MRTLLCTIGAVFLATAAAAQTATFTIPASSLAPKVIVFPASAVNGAGVATVPILWVDGTASAPGGAFASATGTGVWRNSDGTMNLSIAGTHEMRWSNVTSNSNTMSMEGGIGFGATATSPDVFIVRDAAANTLAQRNSTNAQAFRVYNTFTDVNNWELGGLRWATNVLRVGTQNLGTGSARNLSFETTGTVRFTLDTNGNLQGVTATGGVGYGTGAGGTVTQLTNKATGVTLNTVAGDITLNGASLAADTTVSFVLTDSAIAATDCLHLQHQSTGTFGAYILNGRPASGTATIDVHNATPGALAEAIVIRFAVIKCAQS